MKDFFKWFKSSTKMKRWMFLILIGMVLVGYGVARLLTTEEMGLKDLALTIFIFVIGFTSVILSFIGIQKRTLELLVQASDTRNINKGEKVESLIFNKKVYNQGPKIVVIGGGTGLNTVLKGLKKYTDNITAIVTVTDYGAPKESGVNPLENIKESIVALSDNEEEMNRLLNTKFNFIEGKPYFSDLYFAAMEEAYGSFPKSIEASKEVLNITGRVLPVTWDKVTVCAELQDGTIIESKEKIPEIVNAKVSKIDRVYVAPTNCRVADGVLDAIREAEAIVIGPGSLYTNVIPNLLVAGVSRAIKESKAFKVYVGNIMTEFGQTDNFSLSDHIKAIIDHVGEGVIDYCIYDTGEIMPEYIRKYNKEGCELVEQDVGKVKDLGIKLIQRKLSIVEDDIIKHNSDAIATSIIQLICDDLKFNDMQNNAQYIMLDTKIKDTNKKLRKDLNNNEIRKGYKAKKRSNSRASKFFSKYNERIESIRASQDFETKGRKAEKEKIKQQQDLNKKIKQEDKLIKEKSSRLNTINNKKNEKEVNKKIKEKKKSDSIIEKIEKQEQKIETSNNRSRRNDSNSAKKENVKKKQRKSGGKHSKGSKVIDEDEYRRILDKMMK